VSNFDLTGKIAMVTGGGRGIGRAISDALAAHGATIVICGRNMVPMQETVDAIIQRGGRAACIVADVSDEVDVVRLRDQVTAQYGALDILVNNAGIDPHYASMEKTERAEWDRIIGVNLTGVFNCCRHLGALMIARKSGSIINISSIAGHIGLKRQVPYGASKGGVEQLTKSLAHDWAEHGIRVNAIAYGFVETDLTAGMLAHPHIAPRLLARIPMGRFGRADEVHGAAVFLASSASSYVTGHSLMVDGGWTAA
jgi:gluconate 5-dehydrogenase